MNEIKQIDCGDGKINFLPINGGGIINTVENGVAHTIKANYYKTSLANLTRSGSFGATGIIQAVKETGDKMTELKRIGNIYGENVGTGHAGNVWDKNGLAPTLISTEGGNKQPMIIDDVDKLETIVAMRGRNPDNPSDRTVGIQTEQRLEPNRQGVCNTLTSVQKDNLVLEKNKINKIGQISNEGLQCGTVVSDEGLFPTRSAGTHGYCNPHICTKSKKPECINLYDEQGKETSLQDRIYKTDKISPAITTSFRPSYAVEQKKERFFNQALETLAENDCEPGDTINAYNKTVDKSGVCPTLTTRPEGFKTAILPCVNKYRIRKLTPKECFRLMAVTDEDADKMLSINSNSQCYKQAGNSIVVSVLEALFRNLNIKGVKTWNEVKDNYDFYKKAEVMK